MKVCQDCRTENPPRANFCFHCGRPFETRSDELKIVTVLFADLKGFTDLSTHLAPDELKEVVDSCFSLLVQSIEEEGGRVLKHEGDCIMAAFGLSGGADMAPSLACYAALRMQGRMGAFDHPLLARVRRTLSLRIGIHTGQVVIGEVGRMTDILGDTVNVAKRMEQNAPEGGILITEETARHTAMRFQLSEIQGITVKGKQEEVACRLVLGKHSLRRRSILGKSCPTLGRQKEFRRIRELYENVLLSDIPHLHLLEGEAGIGKSRLMQDFSDLLKSLPDQVYICRTNFNSTLSHDYRVFRVFLFRLGLDSTEKIRHCLKADLPEMPDEEKERFVSAVAGLVGYEGGSQTPGGNSQVSLAFSCIRLWFEEVSRTRPIVFLVDDMHWADEGSLRLLDSLLSTLKGRFFVLCAGRPVRKARDFFFTTRNCSGQDIQALLGPQTRRMALEFLRQVEGLPREILDQLVQVSAGNPLYLEEMILHLANQKVLDQRDGVWSYHAQTRTVVKLPTSIELAVQERLDLLCPEDRRVLQAASIFGRQFEWEAAEVLAEVKVSAVRMERIRKTGLVLPEKPQPSGQMPWRFQSELVRDSLYQRMTSRKKRELHTQAGLWLEEYRAEASGPGVLSSHFKQGNRVDKAQFYALAMADQSFRSWQLHRASREYREILEKARSLRFRLEGSRLVEVLERLSLVLGMVGKSHEGLEIVEYWVRAHSAVDAHGLRIMALLFRYPDFLGLEKFEAHFKQVLEAFASVFREPSGNLRLWIEIHIAAAEGFRRLGSEHSRICLKTCEEYLSRLGDEPLRLIIQVEKAILLFMENRLESALEQFLKTHDQAEMIEDARTQARCLHNAGECERRLGRFHDAEKYLHRSIALKEKIGDLAGCLVCLHQMALVKLDQGELQEAELYAKRCLKQSRLVRQRPLAASALCLLSRISAYLKDSIRSLKHAWYALDELEHCGADAETSLNSLLPALGELRRHSPKEALSLVNYMQGRIHHLATCPSYEKFVAIQQELQP